MDYSREEICRMADAAIRKYGGPDRAKVFFKFTCSHCGARCMFAEPNKLFEQGECGECHQTTIVREAGFALECGEGFARLAMDPEKKPS